MAGIRGSDDVLLAAEDPHEQLTLERVQLLDAGIGKVEKIEQRRH